MFGNMDEILLYLLVCLGLCNANGIPEHIGIGVIYVVPAAMALTVLVSIIITLGMLCLNRGDPEPLELEMKTIAQHTVVTEFVGDSTKPESSKNADQGKGDHDNVGYVPDVAGSGDDGGESGSVRL